MSHRITTLANGLRVVTEPMDRVETVSLGIWVGVGARHEPAAVNGISHLLEHMAFKGTARRSARQIAEEIEAVGGYINAWTSREATAYYAKVLKEDVPLAVDLIGDILMNPTFDDEELVRERDVILQEIGQAQDTPDDLVFDHFQEVAFPDQPLGRPIMGRRDIVAGMSSGALRRFQADTYRAGSMVLAAVGAVDHDALVALAGAAFGALPAGTADQPGAAAYAGGDFREARELEQVHLLLGLPGVAILDEDYYPLSVFTHVLGGGMSSRLFQEVRENRGLVYSVYSFHSAWADAGLFGVYAGTGPVEVEALVPVVVDQIKAVARAATDEELARARAQIKAGIVMSLESTSARAEQLASQMLVHGRVLEIEEVVAKMAAVTPADLARTGERLLSGGLTAAAIGPVERLADHDTLSGLLAA